MAEMLKYFELFSRTLLSMMYKSEEGVEVASSLGTGIVTHENL